MMTTETTIEKPHHSSLLASTAHALRRKITSSRPPVTPRRPVGDDDVDTNRRRRRTPGVPRTVSMALRKRRNPMLVGAENDGDEDLDEDSDAASVHSDNDVVLASDHQDEFFAAEAEPPRRGSRVERVVQRMKSGPAAQARRRLSQLTNRVRREPKPRPAEVATAAKGPRRRSRSLSSEEGYLGQAPRVGAANSRVARLTNAIVAAAETATSDLAFLLAECFSATASLAFAVATAVATFALVLTDGGSVWLRCVALSVACFSVASHSGIAATACLRLATSAVSRVVAEHASRAAEDFVAHLPQLDAPLRTVAENPRPKSPTPRKRRRFLRLRRAPHAAPQPDETKDEDDPTSTGEKVVTLHRDHHRGSATKRDNTWWSPDAASFQLRGDNYLEDNIKQPSGPAIYDAVQALVVSSPDGPIRCVSELNEVVRQTLDQFDDDDYDAPLPHFLFACVNLPLDVPSLYSSRQGTNCAVMVTFHRLSDYARAIVDKEADPSRAFPSRAS